MLLTCIAVYLAIAIGVWCIRYMRTADEEAKKRARNALFDSYLECLRWPLDCLQAFKGFDADKQD